MKALYGQDLVDIVSAKEEWTAASELKWFNPRSAALKAIDSALATLETSPTIGNFDRIINLYGAWRRTKIDPRTGRAMSKRGTAGNALVDQLREHKGILDDRVTLMQRVIQTMDQIDWKRRCLCAELYDTADNRDWGAINGYVNWLAAESRASSGWANQFPQNIFELAERGEAEIEAVNNWPNIGFRTKVGLARWIQSETDQIVNPSTIQWPPWNGNPHVRKGLFCHSSAAIAARVIHSQRAVLHAGLRCQIRTIDVVHQQPRERGQMTHWWVCVNRPDELRLSNRVIRFTRTPDFAYLPLMGGFVVDIWGALWLDQQQNGNQWATAGQETPHPCVTDTPSIQIGHRDEATRIQIHHVY